MTAADVDILVSAAYRSYGLFFCPRCDVSLYGSPGTHGRMLCGCGPVTPVAADARRARLLDVAGDLAEELGLDGRATELRWRVVLARARGAGIHVQLAGRIHAGVPRDGMRVEVWGAVYGPGYSSVQYTEGRGWARGNGIPCPAPACAPAVLAALRLALAGGGPHA